MNKIQLLFVICIHTFVFNDNRIYLFFILKWFSINTLNVQQNGKKKFFLNFILNKLWLKSPPNRHQI